MRTRNHHLALFLLGLLMALCLVAPARGAAPSLQDRVLAAMLVLSPPEKHRPPPGWEETTEEARARYGRIAADIAAVARTRVEAAMLVGVAWHESGFSRDVDEGPCFQGKGFKGRCDGGRALGLWQLQATAPELRGDRRAQAREALRRLLHSRKACSTNEPPEQLAAYSGGTCTGKAARASARGLDAAIRKALASMP